MNESSLQEWNLGIYRIEVFRNTSMFDGRFMGYSVLFYEGKSAKTHLEFLCGFGEAIFSARVNTSNSNKEFYENFMVWFDIFKTLVELFHEDKSSIDAFMEEEIQKFDNRIAMRKLV